MGGVASMFGECMFGSESSAEEEGLMGSSKSPLMGSGSGSKVAQPKVTPHDRAVLDLKLARDKLKIYQNNMEKVMAREREMARQLLKDGKRRRAILALKKKRYQEQLLENSVEQLNNIEQMVGISLPFFFLLLLQQLWTYLTLSFGLIADRYHRVHSD
jgi:hypothetical protein